MTANDDENRNKLKSCSPDLVLFLDAVSISCLYLLYRSFMIDTCWGRAWCWILVKFKLYLFIAPTHIRTYGMDELMSVFVDVGDECLVGPDSWRRIGMEWMLWLLWLFSLKKSVGLVNLPIYMSSFMYTKLFARFGKRHSQDSTTLLLNVGKNRFGTNVDSSTNVRFFELLTRLLLSSKPSGTVI